MIRMKRICKNTLDFQGSSTSVTSVGEGDPKDAEGFTSQPIFPVKHQSPRQVIEVTGHLLAKAHSLFAVFEGAD